MRSEDSLGKTLMLGKTEEKGEEVAEDVIDSAIKAMNMNLDKLWKLVEDREAWCVKFKSRKETTE